MQLQGRHIYTNLNRTPCDGSQKTEKRHGQIRWVFVFTPLLNYDIVWRQRAALDASRFFWFFFSLAIMKTEGEVSLWKKEIGKIGREQLVGRMSLTFQRIRGLQKMGSELLGTRRGTKI